ncbi:protein Wnt-4-like isoform X1 [Branchiostoma floridae x Branchiostoma japonicum]
MQGPWWIPLLLLSLLLSAVVPADGLWWLVPWALQLNMTYTARPTNISAPFSSPRLLSKPGARGGSNAIRWSTGEARRYCGAVPWPVRRQKIMCEKFPRATTKVREGANLGIQECQHQFKHRLWNCSTADISVLQRLLSIRSRETAFLHAIVSAGVAYGVARACSTGELQECSCSKAKTKPPPGAESAGGEWEWGGCSHNIRFGDNLSKEFMDANEVAADDTGLMNLHNNEAGRKAIKSNMKVTCKCHGVSGSCATMVCWESMPSFRQVGDLIMGKYHGATYVKINKKGSRLRQRNKRHKRPTAHDVVYLDDSPDYCEVDVAKGSYGTHGRKCNRTSAGVDGCQLLCCNRDFVSREEITEESCNCKFKWCCEVTCKKCKKKELVHYCK